MKKYLCFAILFLAALGCEKDRITIYNEGLLGYWITPEYGVFLERKNAGWCGTPPITYGDFDGTWMEDEDGFIYITSEYWGGTQDLTFKLISVDEAHLVLEIIN